LELWPLREKSRPNQSHKGKKLAHPAALVLGRLGSRPVLVYFDAPERDSLAQMQCAAAQRFGIVGIVGLTQRGVKSEIRADGSNRIVAEILIEPAKEMFVARLAQMGVSTNVARA